MDEFRKPYEYEEERIAGFLRLFVILLVSADMLITAGIVWQGTEAASKLFQAGSIYLVISALYILFLLGTAFIDFTGKRCLITVSKGFLITRAVYSVASLFMIWQMDLHDPTLVGPNQAEFANAYEMTLIVLVLPVVYMLGFSLLWYLYFSKSKKCAELAQANQVK